MGVCVCVCTWVCVSIIFVFREALLLSKFLPAKMSSSKIRSPKVTADYDILAGISAEFTQHKLACSGCSWVMLWDCVRAHCYCSQDSGRGTCWQRHAAAFHQAKSVVCLAFWNVLVIYIFALCWLLSSLVRCLPRFNFWRPWKLNLYICLLSCSLPLRLRQCCKLSQIVRNNSHITRPV